LSGEAGFFPTLEEKRDELALRIFSADGAFLDGGKEVVGRVEGLQGGADMVW